MSRSIALLLVLVLLAASCMIFIKPALSSVDVAENSWVLKSPMPQGGAVYGAAGVNGKICAFGAYYYGADILKSTTHYTSGKYDPATDTWTAIAPMPTSRIEFATAVYENKIYLIGGKKSQIDASLNTVEVYDPATNTWASRTPMPTARDSMQANVVNGKIYVISGQVSLIEAHPGAIFSDATEVYDPQTNTWASGANIPNHVEGYVSAVLDNKIYLIGGRTEEPNIGWHGINTTQIYDPATDKWTYGAPLPKAVISALACATNGFMAPKRIYVFAGFDEIGHRELNQVYDPITNEWAESAKQSFYGYGEMAAAVVEDVMYVIGGSFKELVGPNPWGYTANPDPVYNPPPPFPAVNYQYTPIGYGAFDFTAPRITVLSPENKNYSSAGVSVTFAVDEPAVWMGYRLDGQQIAAIDGNITLNGLTSGSHNITLYAKDTSENTGASETIDFTVAEEQEPFPALAIVAASVAAVLVMGAALLVYRRKRTRREAAIVSG